ncbi:30S ribosomal protein S12 methylthiotransferase RimO [Phascolarctobacterium sp. ET69]|uniref:30S ribosomal protein S12 methylthiotransferase RimO n=1 Tax=Phascolarctobacterium sp. ET69 TaxID=2939420 RepID=UPI0020120A9D|nr:30S ribosomal protein S12 methylthiotransferase RimO [Phascolarctobacterium sp. ET69]
MKIGIVSLGCPKNLVDSETMLGLIHEEKYEITNDPSEAEIIIVNTCGFIESAKEESINTILQMVEYKKSGSCKYIIVTGCLSQRYAEELFNELPEADAIAGVEVYDEIGSIIKRVMNGERFIMLERSKPDVIYTSKETFLPRILTTPSYTAYLKIAEGCDNCCSYCAIPKIRGPYRSKPMEQVLKEAKALADNGVKELIVVAQDTTRYGEDLPGGKLLLADLLKELNKIESLKWIRVMYCYPNNFTDELIETFASLDKVCKYVDLPLQHASNRLLASMNRYDTREEVETLLAKLRKRIPGIVIRTTFIVGFPGETDADFEELKEFVEQQRFENAGVFAYSQEEGTVAGAMPNQIPDEIKQERYHELMALQAQISEEIHKDTEGQTLEVLVEGIEEDGSGLHYGRSYREAPDIDGLVFIENPGDIKPGCFVKVNILQGFTYESVGERI